MCHDLTLNFIFVLNINNEKLSNLRQKDIKNVTGPNVCLSSLGSAVRYNTCHAHALFHCGEGRGVKKGLELVTFYLLSNSQKLLNRVIFYHEVKEI